MLISELIKILEATKKADGDLRVKLKGENEKIIPLLSLEVDVTWK